MRIAVLGATGRVGRVLVQQALERGHEVVALVRRPEEYAQPTGGTVEVRRADVASPDSFPDLSDVEVVISALGVRKGDGPGTLIAGARVLAKTRTAGQAEVLWLGALGSGASTGRDGGIYQAVMKMFVGAELDEKAEADAIVLDAGGTVFHAPDLRVGGISEKRRSVPLGDYPTPFWPPAASRATVAALMLDEAEHAAEVSSHRGDILVPVVR